MRTMTPNYALERSVTGLRERAAGARNDCAPAARRPRLRGPLNADVGRHEQATSAIVSYLHMKEEI